MKNMHGTYLRIFGLVLVISGIAVLIRTIGIWAILAYLALHVGAFMVMTANKSELLEMIAPAFIQIPYEVYSDERLQPLDWALYGFIYWLARLSSNKCTASNPTLAGLCHVEVQSVANALVRLEESDCILRIYADEKKKVRKRSYP